MLAQRATVGIFLIYFAGCAGFPAASHGPTVGTRPTPIPGLTPDRYLFARGSGDTAEQAAKVATAGLAQIFEAKIHADESLIERYSELMSDKKASLTATSDMRRTVTVSSGITLCNLRLTDPVADETGRYVVHAYLDRRETAQLYLQKITANNKRIDYFLAEGAAAPGKVQQYAFLQAAATVAANTQILIDQLAIIHPDTHRQVIVPMQADVLLRQAAEKARDIRFAVDFRGDDAPQVVPFICEVVTAMGFTVGAPPLLTIAGSLSFEPVDMKQAGATFVRYHFQANVVAPDGSTSMTMVSKGREGHVSEAEAKARALRGLRETLQTDLRRQLQTYFDHLVLGIDKPATP